MLLMLEACRRGVAVAMMSFFSPFMASMPTDLKSQLLQLRHLEYMLKKSWSVRQKKILEPLMKTKERSWASAEGAQRSSLEISSKVDGIQKALKTSCQRSGTWFTTILYVGEECTEYFKPADEFSQFFCALPPDKRKVWAKRMAQIICPGGLLVCLEFPLYKDPSSAGPPWGVRGGVYWDVLVRGGNGILDSEISQEEQNEYVNLDGGDFTRELYIKPKRSYDAGRGTDMVSIWMRK